MPSPDPQFAAARRSVAVSTPAQYERCGIAHTFKTLWATDPAAAASSKVVPAVSNLWLARARTPTAALGRYVTALRSTTRPVVHPPLCSSMATRRLAACGSSTSPVTASTRDAASKSRPRGTMVTVGPYPSGPDAHQNLG